MVGILTPICKVDLSVKVWCFGLYRILRHLSEVTDYLQWKNHDIVHILQMKPYHEPEVQVEVVKTQSDDKNGLDGADDTATRTTSSADGRMGISYTVATTRSREHTIAQI